MKITRKSTVSGIERTLEVNVTEDQYKAWAAGELAQVAFPNATADEREFIMTGITKEEWEDLFSEEE